MRKFALLLPAALLLSSCLGDVMEIFCEAGPDSDHCYQTVAVQESEPEDCSKIQFPPPRSKCHLMIAENTGDPTACENMADGGMMGYSKEECLDAAFRNHSPEDCSKTADEAACRSAWAKNGKGCGEGFVYASGACEEEREAVSSSSPADGGTDDDIESKAEQDLNTIKDAATGKYMELLEQAIENEDDDAKKAGLEAYKEFLEKSGESMETVTTTVDQLKEIKRIFLDAYDPSMDIDKMPVNKILDPGLFDRISSKLFGEDPPTERSKAESALEVYEKMLERQGEIDFLQKGRLERIGDVVSSKAQGSLTEQLKEKATDVAEKLGGTAFMTVGIVDHALSSFQEAAQKEMFIGLAAAYNRQRDAITASSPNLSPEEIHRRTVASVKEDPYQDVPNAGFVKYGNLLENRDCQDEGNPLCIDNRVFWISMDKTYQYTHK